jgi:hypothetical protein
MRHAEAASGEQGAERDQNSGTTRLNRIETCGAGMRALHCGSVLLAVAVLLPVTAACVSERSARAAAAASECSRTLGGYGTIANAVGLLRLRGGGKELKIQHRAFVANLPRTLTDKGLREAFEEFGKVKEARVRAQAAAH